MNKTPFDKHYTSNKLANETIFQFKKYLIGSWEDIKNLEFIEPSAGDWVFIKHLIRNWINPSQIKWYDICVSSKNKYNIIKKDFLLTELKPGIKRVFIWNPPFWSNWIWEGRGILLRKFFNKMVENGEYIAMILPWTQYQHENGVGFKFNLEESIDLWSIKYKSSWKNVLSCFNIYRKNSNWKLNKRRKINIEWVYYNYCRWNNTEKKEKLNNIRKEFEYSFAFTDRGKRYIREIDEDKEYWKGYDILVFSFNDEELYKKCKNILIDYNFFKRFPSTSNTSFSKYKLFKILQENLKNNK